MAALSTLQQIVLSWDPDRVAKPKSDLEALPLEFEDESNYVDCVQEHLIEECRSQLSQGMDEIVAQEAEGTMFPRMTLIHSSKDGLFTLCELELKSDVGEMADQLQYNTAVMLKKPDHVVKACPPLEHARCFGVVESRSQGSTVGTLSITVKICLDPNGSTVMADGKTSREKIMAVALTEAFAGHEEGQSGDAGATADGFAWDVLPVCNLVTLYREFRALWALVDCKLRVTVTKPKLTLFASDRPRISAMEISSELSHILRTNYNTSQFSAMKAALQGDEITLIQGPPGTGKTRTILGLLSVLLNARNKQPQAQVHASNDIVAYAAAASRALEHTEATAPDSFPHFHSSMPWLRGGSVADNVSSEPNRENPNVKFALEKRYTRGTFHDLAPKIEQKLTKRVLVTAPSNAAVDEIVRRILSDGLFSNMGEKTAPTLVRVGPGVDKSLMHVSLEAIVRDKVAADPKLTPEDVTTAVLSEAAIVCTTLSCSGSPALGRVPGGFDTVLIDEAAQAVEPSTLIPLQHGCHRLVLVGDPKQLTATVISRQAERSGYGRSMFERFVECGIPVSVLDTQYRMHPSISAFPSANFYQAKLLNSDCVVARGALTATATASTDTAMCERVHLTDDTEIELPRTLPEYTFIHVRGVESRDGTKSWKNEREQHVVSALVRRLFDREMLVIAADATTTGESAVIQAASTVGVIAPYVQQVKDLRKMLKEALPEFGRHVEVNSVDGFQGREKKHIIITCVRSNGRGSIGFVREPRRLNVALTRATHSVCVVGNSECLSKGDEVWKALVEDAKVRGCIVYADAEQNEGEDESKKKKRDAKASSNANKRRAAKKRGAEVVEESSTPSESKRTRAEGDDGDSIAGVTFTANVDPTVLPEVICA